jgi:transcriptional regulator with XRE-family HTH domain
MDEGDARTTRPRRATVNDVARLAGVSIATVSKALNDRGQVRAETQERVRRAAEQLDFVPNSLARGLLEGKTGTVGLLTNDLEGRFSLPILMGAEDAFGADSVSVILSARCSVGASTVSSSSATRPIRGHRSARASAYRSCTPMHRRWTHATAR